ncbi:MAG: DUF4131 domain-containing protein, partial [Proteobacteria bacterium]|nr:DUF4131 domain-containing protein [Pseudomonadota bacterium]
MEFRAGMFIYALAFLLGTLMAQQLSVLPEPWSLFVISVAAGMFCLLVYRIYTRQSDQKLKSYYTLTISFIILILIGFNYSVLYAVSALDSRLDKSYIGKSLIIRGQVSGLPSTSSKVQRFEFEIESYRLKEGSGSGDHEVNPDVSLVASSSGNFPQKVRLSWYYGETVNAGETWQLEVR